FLLTHEGFLLRREIYSQDKHLQMSNSNQLLHYSVLLDGTACCSLQISIEILESKTPPLQRILYPGNLVAYFQKQLPLRGSRRVAPCQSITLHLHMLLFQACHVTFG